MIMKGTGYQIQQLLTSAWMFLVTIIIIISLHTIAIMMHTMCITAEVGSSVFLIVLLTVNAIYITIIIIIVILCIITWLRLRKSKVTTHGPVGWRGSNTGEDTITLPVDVDDRQS